MLITQQLPGRSLGLAEVQQLVPYSKSKRVGTNTLRRSARVCWT